MKKNIRKKLNNNDYLIKLNMSDAPRDVRMQWLCKIIDNEMAKNIDEIDMDLVNECQEELDELMQEARTERASEQAAITSVEPDYAGNLASRGRVYEKNYGAGRRTVRTRLVALVAAVIVVFSSMAVISVVAKSQGYVSAFEFVAEKAKEIFNSKKGTVIKDGNIAIVRNGQTKNYASIDELVQQEDLDIMYPTELPEELKIEKVVVMEVSDEKRDIAIIFKDTMTTMSIYNYFSMNQELIEQEAFSIIESNSIVFYLLKFENSYYAICHKENIEYTIITQNHDHLKILINSLTGEEQ